jgi:nitrous oxidase accessory protein NosD
MFGFASRRRLVAVAGAVAALLALAIAVQASASGASAPKPPVVPKALSLKDQAAANQAKLRTQAAATNVHCGQTITATTTLNGDLNCTGQNGLIIGANSVTLNLNGHTIFGSNGVNDNTVGVTVNGTSDTVKNGYIEGFAYGVNAFGTNDTVTTLQVNYTDQLGIYLAGVTDKATSDTAAENFNYGLYDFGSGDTIQSDHLLNNNFGLVTFGRGEKVLDNIADGNTNDGILVQSSPPATVTGNTANFNGGYGINATSPKIDGGTNTAKGNTNPQQCRGVVCS